MSEKVCRLCLHTISNNHHQAVEESILKTLKLNLKISNKTVMCIECAHSLQIFSKFTSGQVYVGDETSPLSNFQNNVKLDAVKIEVTSNLKSLLETDVKCSFCAETRGREDLIPLNESKKNKTLVNILEQYISKMNSKNTEELLTCETCLEALQSVLNFILNCLEVEKKISEYIELEGTDGKGQIELKEVQQFMFKPRLKLDIESVNVNKLEEKCDQIQEKDIKMAEAEIKYEKEISHPELIIKTEYADIKSELTISDITDIKSEQSDCDGFQESFIDNNISNDSLHKLEVISEVRNGKEKTFCCEVCPYKTKHKGYWKRHLLIHKRPLLKCDLCSYKAKKKYALKIHLLTHQSPSEVKMFKCELCSYATKRNSNLMYQHSLTHKRASELKMLKCAQCSYETRQKHLLRTHSMTHIPPNNIYNHHIMKC